MPGIKAHNEPRERGKPTKMRQAKTDPGCRMMCPCQTYDPGDQQGVARHAEPRRQVEPVEAAVVQGCQNRNRHHGQQERISNWLSNKPGFMK